MKKTPSARESGIGRFTSVTVDEPAGCKVPGNTLTTVPLTATAAMGNTEATRENVYLQVVSTSGEAWSTFKVTECFAAGTYQFGGVLYLKATNPTGTAAVWQEVVASPEI